MCLLLGDCFVCLFCYVFCLLFVFVGGFFCSLNQLIDTVVICINTEIMNILASIDLVCLCFSIFRILCL